MAKKRSHGEGTISQLPSGSWRGRVFIDGKRLTKTSPNKKEIINWLRTTTEQVKQGLTYDSARVTIGDYLKRWLAGKKNSVRPGTFEHYHILIEKYLTPALGGMLIKDLTTDRIQFTYDEWIRKGVGIHTVEKAHAVLHQALERAVQTGLAIRNVAQYVNKPQVEEKEMKFWTEEEANRFLAASRDNRLYALFHLAIATGARQMELLGLQWTDLDMITGRLNFRRQLARKGEMFAPLKTRAAKRTLILGSDTITALQEHFNRQQQERQIAGQSWQETGLIFTNTIGGPMHHKNLMDRYFYPLVKAADVPVIRFHDLRHTAVAIMLSHGIPIFVVSKIIGHARPSITSDTYGHLLPGATAEIGQMMDDLISPVEIPVDDLKL